MRATNEGIDVLNALLRGEIAATETYQQAMEKLSDDPHLAELKQMHAEHREAANTLRIHVRQHGGEPTTASGAWGAWAKFVEGTAKLFGDTAALKALKEGEEHGLKEYEDALADNALPSDCKSLIQSRLLPQTRNHISALDRIMDAQ
jgi:uncharacterized protein (TIGR02284 family)